MTQLVAFVTREAQKSEKAIGMRPSAKPPASNEEFNEDGGPDDAIVVAEKVAA